MLTKLQKKHYKEIKKKFNENNQIEMPDSEYLVYQDVLSILCERHMLMCIPFDGGKIYFKEIDFSVFDEWLEDIEKEEKKLNRREWKIAIIGGSIGALIGLIPDVIRLFSK